MHLQQLFRDETLSCFTNILTEQLNLEDQWEFATSKNPSHQCIEVSQRESSPFVIKEKFNVFTSETSRTHSLNSHYGYC